MDVFLDTNAVSYFDECPPQWQLRPATLARARLRVMERVADGSLSVFVSWTLLNELVGICESNPEKYVRTIGFLWKIANNNLLLPTDALARAEVQHGRRLEGNDRLEPRRTAVTVRRATLSCRQLAAAELPRLTREQVDQFKNAEEARQREARRRINAISKRPLAKGSRKWWANADANVDDWVTDFMTNSCERLRLSKDVAKWPPPRALESAWRYHAYKMARIHLNVGEGRRVDGSDLFDADQYVSASYCDVLVTDDAGFRETIDIIPRPTFKVVGFRQFVTQELGIRRW
jgi:hypothetical protein